jgi:uncharacterized protein YegJ (DUF2314 family)
MNRLWKWLDDAQNWWASTALLLGAWQFYWATALGRWTIGGWPRPSLLGAAAGIAFAVLQFAGQRWSRWLWAAWVLLLIVSQTMDGFLQGWTLMRGAGLVALLVMAIAGYFVFFRGAKGGESEEEEYRPFLSLVLLLREPRYLDATVLAALASRAWGIEVTGTSAEEPDDDDDDDAEPSAKVAPQEADAGHEDADEDESCIIGDSPLYFGSHPDALFAIHHFDRPYFDDPEEIAQEMVELRIRRAILEHQAWIAVDVMHWHGRGDAEKGAYRLIARLLAELADDNVLAVVDPDAHHIYCYDPETERKLRSDDPRAELREAYYSPIIEIRSDDPGLQAAVAEAHRRWPEFVAAFEARAQGGDDVFAVKAPFGREDNTEFMWVKVTGIENDVIYGTLENEPAGIPDLHEGDRVKVPVGDINDWMMLVGDEPIGGFTVKLLMERANRPPDGDTDTESK